jgi:hypothetical protein
MQASPWFTTHSNYTLRNKKVLVCSLVGDHLLLRGFGPYGMIFMNLCTAITVAMVTLLKNSQPNAII